jgi:hypothetical protein
MRADGGVVLQLDVTARPTLTGLEKYAFDAILD